MSMVPPLFILFFIFWNLAQASYILTSFALFSLNDNFIHFIPTVSYSLHASLPYIYCGILEIRSTVINLLRFQSCRMDSAFSVQYTV